MTTMSSQHPARYVRNSAEDAPRGDRSRWTDRSRRIERLTKLAVLLDSSITIPGTRARIGIDPLLGLIPGFGDAISLVLSAYIIWEAKQIGTPRATLIAMLANVGIDAAIGTVPVLGDAIDFAFKANMRNLKLLGIDPAGRGVNVDLGSNSNDRPR